MDFSISAIELKNLFLSNASKCKREVRQILWRLGQVEKVGEWINAEETLLKKPLTPYIQVDEITLTLDPFKRMYALVARWQKSFVKWMDGNFSSLDSEVTESEVDEMSRELFKISKGVCTYCTY